MSRRGKGAHERPIPVSDRLGMRGHPTSAPRNPNHSPAPLGPVDEFLVYLRSYDWVAPVRFSGAITLGLLVWIIIVKLVIVWL